MLNTKLAFKKESGSFPFDLIDNTTLRVSYVPVRTGTYSADLYGYIESASQFSEIIAALELMEETDEFVLNLSSGGGSLNAADTLIHAIKKTKGHFHVVATGNISSAATFILLHAHSFELSEGFNSLIHCGSLVSGGNFNEYKQEIKFSAEFMENSLKRAYEGFLTDPEMDEMLKGVDRWITSEEWVERHEARNAYFVAKEKAEREPVLVVRKPKKAIAQK